MTREEFLNLKDGDICSVIKHRIDGANFGDIVIRNTILDSYLITNGYSGRMFRMKDKGYVYPERYLHHDEVEKINDHEQ